MSRTPTLFDAYGVPVLGEEGPAPKRPRGVELYLQVPQIEVLASWDTDAAKAAARAHELGRFQISARLYYAQLTDAKVLDGVERRALAVRKMSFDIVPGKGRGARELARKAAAFYETMVSPGVQGEMFSLSLLNGFGVGQPEWAYWREGDETFYPILRPWHPQLLYYLANPPAPRHTASPGTLMTYSQGTESGDGALTNIPVIPGTGQWMVFAFSGADKPWLYAKMRATWRPWIGRLQALTGLIRYNNVHGMPVRAVEMPAGFRKTPEGQKFLRNVAFLGQDATMYMPTGTTNGKPAVNVRFIEATAQTYSTFLRTLTWGGQEITIVLTGGQDSYDAERDSYKKAGERQEIRHDTAVADALAWQRCQNRDLFVPFAVLNGYAPEAAPQLVVDTRPAVNKLTEAKVAAAQGEAIVKLVDAWKAMRENGVQMPLKEFLESRGVSLPPSAVEAVDPAEAEVERAEAMKRLPAGSRWVPSWHFRELGARAQERLREREDLLRQYLSQQQQERAQARAATYRAVQKAAAQAA